MRSQEHIYIQNQNSAVRNKDILNVNMSSDICVFNAPTFNISGGTKIICSSGCCGDESVYIISTATTIPLIIEFTGNTSTFSGTNANFKYEIYEYNSKVNAFTAPSIYASNIITYSGLSASSYTIIQNISVSEIPMDGEFLIKGYYEFDACTDFMNLLGKKIDTLQYRSGNEYGLYNADLDFYFLAMSAAETPTLLMGTNPTSSNGSLFQQTILPSTGENTFSISQGINGNFIVTLNGLALAQNLDYIYDSTISTITLSSNTVSDDIMTIIYTSNGANSFTTDVINILLPVVSGSSNEQGLNMTYFNTGTSKYEIFTKSSPQTSSSILVTINGVLLAENIDYYQSKTNPNRIILEGNILEGDIIIIAYFPVTNLINGITNTNPSVSWNITNPPQNINGYFSLQVSTGNTFNTLYSSGYTPYIIGETTYSDTFIASGSVGTTLFYRVLNEKNYDRICGDIISSSAYSQTIPIIIQTNSINSY